MTPPLVVWGVDKTHLDVPVNGRCSCVERRIGGEVEGTEMLQLPLLPGLRIRRPSQRDREPHGQYGIKAGNKVNLDAHGKRSTK